MIRKKKVWWCQLTIPKSKESTALAMTSRVPPPQQLPHIPLPQLGVQPQFWNSAGCPDPTISPVCLGTGTKRKTQTWQKTPELKVVETQKYLKHVRTYHRAAAQTLNFASQTETKVQQCCKKISIKSLKLTRQIFEIALRNGYHLPNQQNTTFSIWKKKKAKETCFNFKLNWLHAVFC